MALSGLVWSVGNTLWLMEAAVFVFIPWWAGFLVLMIAGERLELSRLRQPTPLIRFDVSRQRRSYSNWTWLLVF